MPTPLICTHRGFHKMPPGAPRAFVRLRRPAAVAMIASALAAPSAVAASPRMVMQGAPAAAPIARIQLEKGKTVIDVAPSIAIAAGEDTPLAIEVSPPSAAPRSSFIRIRGLPQGAILSEGFAISAGLWAVPLNGLSRLRIRLPAALTEEARLTLALVTVDGITHAETTLALVPPPAKTGDQQLPQGTASIPGPPSAPAPEPGSAAADLQQAKDLFAQGRQKLASGNIAAARMFYRRAADAGLAEAAFALGATYDPDELSRLKVVGLQSDPATARRWYERARALGFKGADDRLGRLGAR